MKNEKIIEKDELIPLLIKYVKVNKAIFSIERVKYLSNEEIIKILTLMMFMMYQESLINKMNNLIMLIYQVI